MVNTVLADLNTMWLTWRTWDCLAQVSINLCPPPTTRLPFVSDRGPRVSNCLYLADGPTLIIMIGHILKVIWPSATRHFINMQPDVMSERAETAFVAWYESFNPSVHILSICLLLNELNSIFSWESV